MWGFEEILAFVGKSVGSINDAANPYGSALARLLAQKEPTRLFNTYYKNGLSDLLVNANTALAEGIYAYKKITVNQGFALSCNAGYGLIFVADEIVVNGTITASGRGGPGAASRLNAGGSSNGNTAPSVPLSYAGTGGGGGGASSPYTGGAGGATLLPGGFAGAALAVGGVGNATNDSMKQAMRLGIGDKITPYEILIGSGGGSGGLISGSSMVSGAGGAGGGYLFLIANSIAIGVTGAVLATGANGGNASGSSANAGGGGGGGGGTLVLSSRALTNAGSISVAGGSGGAAANSGATGGQGGTGALLTINW